MPKAAQKSKRIPLPAPTLPRYTKLNRAGTLFFIVGDGRLVPLPDDPTTPEFKAAYSAALVERIKADVDIDDLHAQQRKEKHLAWLVATGGTDTEQAERAVALFAMLVLLENPVLDPVVVPVFRQLECDLAMLRARDRLLQGFAEEEVRCS
jgi:hypothetical protein